MNLFHQGPLDTDQLRRIVEASLLASSQPLALPAIYALFPEESPAPLGSIEAAIEELQAQCETRGVELVQVASGWRYQVKTDVHAWVARLWTERQTKYTRATLETLALIAYRQPITRGEIESIRGVSVNPNTIKALEEREWVRVLGHRDVPGRPELLGTTKTFLDYFGLQSLDQLPPLTELGEIPELEPQLPFDEAPIQANAAMADAIVQHADELREQAAHPGDDITPVETTAESQPEEHADDQLAARSDTHE